MADSTTKQAQDLLRAQALCGSPAALDLLLAFREVEATEKLAEAIRRELTAWEAARKPTLRVVP